MFIKSLFNFIKNDYECLYILKSIAIGFSIMFLLFIVIFSAITFNYYLISRIIVWICLSVITLILSYCIGCPIMDKFLSNK